MQVAANDIILIKVASAMGASQESEARYSYDDLEDY
jgi:hypothetical protein